MTKDERKQFEQKITSLNHITMELLSIIRDMQAELDPSLRCPRCGSASTTIVERLRITHQLEHFCEDCGHHFITADPNPTYVDPRQPSRNLTNLPGE